MTQAMVFVLMVGWLGGFVVLRWTADIARDMGRRNSWTVGIPRLVSWACFLALATAGLWRIAAPVTR